MLRSGADWQHLPLRYGKWKTMHRGFSRWCDDGVWEKVFDGLTVDRDNTYLMLDITNRPRGPARGVRKRGGKDPALGRY